MTYLGPTNESNLLNYLYDTKTNVYVPPSKKTVFNELSKLDHLSNNFLVLKIAGFDIISNQDMFNTTLFVYDNNTFPQHEIVDISTSINFIKKNSINRSVTYNQLLKCNGLMLETKNDIIKKYIQVKNDTIFVDGQYIISKSIECVNGVIHILQK
jgi:hypothetical protein